jgi:hypothetical protein
MRFASFMMLALTSTAAFGQRQPPPDLKIGSEEKARIILKTAEDIERYYFEPAKGNKIAAALRDALKQGPIAEAHSALELVPPVNRLFRDNGGDAHLRFGYQAEPAPADTGDAPETPAQRADRIADAAQNGYGIHGVQRLDGNIGLLTWMKFHDPDIAGAAVAAAMTLLAPTDAMIIDLRDSDGGSPHMVALLVSYFMPATEDPVLLSTIENRYKGITEQFWTSAWLPATRYSGKPVYILTSKRTFSAGEGFLEAMRRVRGNVTIVGETTKGGARLSRWMMVHPNFAVSVSVAHHVGETKDWEGVGIKPDVEVVEGDALTTALKLCKDVLQPHKGGT